MGTEWASPHETTWARMWSVARQRVLAGGSRQVVGGSRPTPR
ncbi:hypothetical protein OHA10_03245 [Kribbella sp. NBC_00662]